MIGEQAGSTVWTGNAFTCTSHEISLFHSDYGSPNGAYGECSDIQGKSVKTIAIESNVFLFFFKGADTLSRKKNCPETHT